jgi:hypothetical protein
MGREALLGFLRRGRRTAMNREEWLAKRNSPSFGRIFRARGRYIFVSAPLTLVDAGKVTQHYELNNVGKATYYSGKTLIPVVEGKKGYPVIKGRNERKRQHRATKSARKDWRKVA